MNFGFPADLTVYKLLTDLGSFIGGSLALVAGFFAYKAARRAANATLVAAQMQIAESERRMRLRARSMAIAIHPDLRTLERRIDAIKQSLSSDQKTFASQPGQYVMARIQQLGALSLPPMVERNIDDLYILGDPAGSACIELVQGVMEYNLLLGGVTGKMLALGPGEWIAGIPQLETALDQLQELSRRAAGEVQGVRDR